MILFEDDNPTETYQDSPPASLDSSLFVSDPASLNSALHPSRLFAIRQRIEQLSGRPDTLRDSLQSTDRVEVLSAPGLLRKRDVTIVDLVGVSVVSLGLTADRKT